MLSQELSNLSSSSEVNPSSSSIRQAHEDSKLDMSNYAPAPQKPDGRVFASYPMPAKIDLLKEAPRRESLVEQQLERQIGSSLGPPRIEISQENFQSTHEDKTAQLNYPQQSAINRQVQVQHLSQTQGQVIQGPSRIETMTANANKQSTIGSKNLNNAAILASELAAKEAKLMAEITAFHQRPYSPFQVPDKIDLTSEQREVQKQYQNAPSPRPHSRTSSSRCTSADLLDKEAKLLQEIEEIGRKPFNPQTMVVEREQWYEYPEGRPNDRQLTDSRRRIRDFCSLPQGMYPGEGIHVHEDNLPVSSLGSSGHANNMHTTIIRSPRREIDNKSPLPFAFDNFTTKGVRGNIASVGAIEPDRPRPPIYPIIKRTPSPNVV